MQTLSKLSTLETDGTNPMKHCEKTCVETVRFQVYFLIQNWQEIIPLKFSNLSILRTNLA